MSLVLTPGDEVVIRRTSGTPQRAYVLWVRGDMLEDPEVISFRVVWEEEGRELTKACRGKDLISQVF